MKRQIYIVVFLLAATLAVTFSSACAQVAGAIPQFKDYSASSTYSGGAAAVILDDPEKRKYRTRLQDASRRKANFAGAYSLVTWGCGDFCEFGAAVNLQTGKVVFLPAAVCCWGASDTQFKPVEFRSTSRLVVLSGQLAEQGDSGAHFFELRDDRFLPIKSMRRAPVASAALSLTKSILGLLQNNAQEAEILKRIASSNISVREDGGLTPLIAAVYAGRPKVVKQLLEKGADPNLSDDLNRSPIWFATMRRDVESARLLLNLPTIRRTLSSGDGELGVSPLHMALDRGDLEFTRMLIDAGADTGILDKMGRSPKSICTSVPAALDSIQQACRVLR